MKICTIEIRRYGYDFNDEVFGVYEKAGVKVKFSSTDPISVAIGKELRNFKYCSSRQGFIEEELTKFLIQRLLSVD